MLYVFLFIDLLLLTLILYAITRIFPRPVKKNIETKDKDLSVFKKPDIKYVENMNPHAFPVVSGTNPELAVETHMDADYVRYKKKTSHNGEENNDNLALRTVLPFEHGGLNMNNNSTNHFNH